MCTPTSSEEEPEAAGGAGTRQADGLRPWLHRLAAEASDSDVQSEQWQYNHRAASSDAAGLSVSCFNLLVLLVTHTGQGWLALGPALACLVYVPHMAAVLLLIVCRRRAFATWRKPLGSLATLHTALNVRVLATHTVRADYSSLHGGSSLRMLVAFLLPYSPAFWIGLFSMHGRLPLRWDVAMCPLLTLATASFGRSSCHNLVRDAGTHRPLDALYFWSSSLCGAPLLPWGMPLARDATEPLEQCLVLDTWFTLALGVALPLLVHVRRWQRAQHARRPAHALQARWGVGTTYLLACALWVASAGLVALSTTLHPA